MNTIPFITVLLPVYNCEKYIIECIDSILCQTYSNYELLIIDDCSIDTTVALIQKYNDDRIKLTIKEKNTGYTESLNWGIENAKGKYIARMDGDDICIPTRFEEQIKILEDNSDVFVCGGWAKIIGKDRYKKAPETNDQIFRELMYKNPIVHPTVMFRKEVFENYKYDKNFEPAEDYNLWTRLIFNYNFYNIQKTLIYYREHEFNVSKQKTILQQEKTLESKYYFYEKIVSNNIQIDLKEFKRLHQNKIESSLDFLKKYQFYKNLLNYKKNNINKEVHKLMKFQVHELLITLPFKITNKVFFKLRFVDKLRFIKYYFKN